MLQRRKKDGSVSCAARRSSHPHTELAAAPHGSDVTKIVMTYVVSDLARCSNLPNRNVAQLASRRSLAAAAAGVRLVAASASCLQALFCYIFASLEHHLHLSSTAYFHCYFIFTNVVYIHPNTYFCDFSRIG